MSCVAANLQESSADCAGLSLCKVLAKKQVPEGLAAMPILLLFFLSYMTPMTKMIVLRCTPLFPQAR